MNPRRWWTGEDSNLRSPQGAADLQSAGFSHSPTRPAKTSAMRTSGPVIKFSGRKGLVLRFHPDFDRTALWGVPKRRKGSRPKTRTLFASLARNPSASTAEKYRSPQISAGGGNRTPDPLITNQMLYQLSYASPAQTLKNYHTGNQIASDLINPSKAIATTPLRPRWPTSA